MSVGDKICEAVKSITATKSDYKLPKVSSVKDAVCEVGAWNGVVFYPDRLQYYNNEGFFDMEKEDRENKYLLTIGFANQGNPRVSGDSVIYDFGSHIIAYKMVSKDMIKATITVLKKTDISFRIQTNGTIVFDENSGSLYILQGGNIWVELPGPSDCKDAFGKPIQVKYAFNYDTQTLSFIVSETKSYPIVIDPTIIDNNGQGSRYPLIFGSRIARDRAGNIYVCWDEYTSSTSSVIYLSVFTPSMEVIFDHLQLVSSTGGIVDTQPDALHGSIIIDGFDKLHFIYWQRLVADANRVYRYSKCIDLKNINLSSSWYIANETTNGSEQITDGYRGVGNICVDSSQRIYFVYGLFDGTYYLVRARKHNGPGAGNTWSPSVTIRTLSMSGTELFLWACVDMDSNGYLHVIMADRVPSAEYYVVYCHSVNPYDISAWSSQITILYLSSSVVAHAFGNIRCFGNKIMVTVVLSTGTSPYTNYLMYNYYNGSVWTQGTGTPSGTTVVMADHYPQGCFSNLTVDGQYNCYIGYQKRADHYIYYRKWNYATETWGGETLLLTQSLLTAHSTAVERYLKPTDTKAYVLVWDRDAEPDVLYLYDFPVNPVYNSTIAFM